MSRQDPPPRPDRAGVWGPAGHAAASGVLAGAGAAAATAWGVPAAEVWTGVPMAWAIQAAAVWWLQEALREGRSATRAWVGGMAARVAGLGVVAVVAWATDQDGAVLALAYVATIVPLLWLEGLWLARAGPADGRTEDDDLPARPGPGGSEEGTRDERSR